MANLLDFKTISQIKIEEKKAAKTGVSDPYTRETIWFGSLLDTQPQRHQDIIILLLCRP